MYQHVHYRTQSIVNLQLLSRYFSYRIIFFEWTRLKSQRKKAWFYREEFWQCEEQRKSLPCIHPFYSLWSCYGVYTGMFVFDSIVLVPYELINLKSSQGYVPHNPCFILYIGGIPPKAVIPRGMLRPLWRLFLWQHLAALKGQKCEIGSCKWSDMQKSLARGAATDCRPFIPTVLFWALQVLWRWHQRCRWGRRPAGSLAELSSGEVGLWFLLPNSVHCVAANSQWRVARAAWCTRHPRGGVAPHPWRLGLEAASGALGGCGGCGVARGDGRIICFMGSKRLK